MIRDVPITLSEMPLPAGMDAVAESGLLAQALMAARPWYAEARFAAQQADITQASTARASTAQASTAQGSAGTLHLVLNRDGEVIQDCYIARQADGTGRYYQDVTDDAKASATDLVVEIGDLLTARLARLAEVIGEVAGEEYLAPITAALRSAQATLSAGGTDPELAAIGQQLLQACLLAADADAQLAAGREMVEAAATAHLGWQLDGWSMAAVLIAANVPIACAAGQDGQPGDAQTFTRYLGTAASALHSGDWQQVSVVVAKALREEHGRRLAALAADLYSEAVRRADTAVDGPPSPMIFGGQLFEALPYALAAWWISRWAADAGTPAPNPAPGKEGDTWLKRRTDAEELYVRMTDGIFAQWSSYVTGALAAERREIMAVAQAKGKLAANELIRKGEASYHRPRSLRPYLLGERDTPDGS
jgi:hypothetical protein